MFQRINASWFRVWHCCVLLVASTLTPQPLLAQVDDRYTFWLAGTVTAPTATVTVNADVEDGTAGPAQNIATLEFGVCHDADALTLSGVVPGAAVNALSPFFQTLDLSPPGGAGFTAIYSFNQSLTTGLPAGLGQELVAATYDYSSQTPTCVTLCGSLGDPIIAARVRPVGPSPAPSFYPATIDVELLSPTPQILYVDDNSTTPTPDGSSWSTAFPNLQDAIAAVDGLCGTEIRMGAGIYRPDQGFGLTPGGTAASFDVRGVTLRGGYQGIGTGSSPDDWDPILYKARLSGDLAGNDLAGFVNTSENSRTILKAKDSTMIGFFFEGGNATTGTAAALEGRGTIRCEDCFFRRNDSSQWGSLQAAEGSTVELIRCSFFFNRAPILLEEVRLVRLIDTTISGDLSPEDSLNILSRGTVFLDGCTFENNETGCFIEMRQRGTATIRNCSFIGTASVSQALGERSLLLELDDFGLIEDCFFDQNSSWLEVCTFNSPGNGIVRRCVFQGTTNHIAPAVVTGDDVDVYDCLIVDNLGGGIAFYGSVVNCTIAGNGGAGIALAGYIPGGSREVVNCVVAGNAGGSHNGDPVPVRYSFMEGGYPGVGNIAGDPMFVGAGDYHLLSTSPCLDAGENAATDSLVDLEGNPRRLDAVGTPDTGVGTAPIVDMGAYEHSFACQPVTVSLDADAPLGVTTHCVTFTDTTTGDVIVREWDFDGDGTTDATAAIVDFQYTESGDYNASLNIEGACGDTGSASVQIQVVGTGDCNADGSVDIADAVGLALHLFGGAPQPSCPNACDSNGDGATDLGDVVFSLAWLFGSGPAPMAQPDCTLCD